jgi:Tfp pilus assembly protein PilE
MKNVNESGRSMVEMLGVLAIIGVLSIGGIAGYTMAMNRYRANEGLADANLAIVESMTREKDVNYASNIGALPSGVNSIIAKADGTATVEYNEPAVASVANEVKGNNSPITVKVKTATP